MDLLSPLLIGFVLGLGFAWFDLKKGNFWYRAWFKLTHKEGLDSESDLTFLKGQPFSARLIPAILISIIVVAVFKVTGNLNFFLNLWYSGLILVGLLAAFYLFPFFMQRIRPQLQNVQKTIKKIDEIEASARKVDKPKAEPEKIDPKKPDDDEDKDWRKGVKDFLDK